MAFVTWLKSRVFGILFHDVIDICKLIQRHSADFATADPDATNQVLGSICGFATRSQKEEYERLVGKWVPLKGEFHKARAQACLDLELHTPAPLGVVHLHDDEVMRHPSLPWLAAHVPGRLVLPADDGKKSQQQHPSHPVHDKKDLEALMTIAMPETVEPFRRSSDRSGKGFYPLWFEFEPDDAEPISPEDTLKVAKAHAEQIQYNMFVTQTCRTCVVLCRPKQPIAFRIVEADKKSQPGLFNFIENHLGQYANQWLLWSWNKQVQTGKDLCSAAIQACQERQIKDKDKGKEKKTSNKVKTKHKQQKESSKPANHLEKLIAKQVEEQKTKRKRKRMESVDVSSSSDSSSSSSSDSDSEDEERPKKKKQKEKKKKKKKAKKEGENERPVEDEDEPPIRAKKKRKAVLSDD